MMGKSNAKVLNPICCYCGKAVATTKDHIPPKAIFNKPRPSDLITVPACRDCNNGASTHDELFMAFLGMHVAGQRGEAERLFKEGTLKTVKRNKRLYQMVAKTIKPVNVITPGGIFTGKGYAVPWDSDAHDAVIERIVRGLFFYHYSTILADKADISVQWFNGLPDIDLTKLYTNSVAGGAFVYAYNKALDTDFDSIWLFQFYNGHWAGGHTLGRDSVLETNP
ncbi:MAG: hypothetical protein JST27_04910 [Bacteroidetes bacterium]|nr:hypothetical protein [Bacteroidota bacterium]